ncbi:Protease Do-like 9 [Durusdinium trenchii]|uniref:Protease Do-like 9 n=1 Tax=Durusdinium trenchii TaxID=1381693 RepID=A0ABP0SS66_9DINO
MARAGDFEKEARPRHTWNKEGPPSFGTMLKWDVGGEEDLTDAVVKVFAAVSEPNYAVPWVYKPQDARTGTAFAVTWEKESQWLLTNAHVIRHAAVIQVRKRGDHQKFLAKLLCVGLDCDLAILTVESPQFWDGLPRVRLRREDALPRLQEEVTVVGYPIGGDNACVTVGVVSRIDMQRYNVCWTQSLLAIQIDAAINPGNSGGPCFGAGDFSGCLLGVAFQVLGREDAENIGYIIPAEVVHHFLTDYIQNQRYTGFGSCGFAVQPLENARMRLALGLKPHQSGVRVTMVHPASAAHEVVSVGDLIIKVQGQEIGDDGKVPFRGTRNERIDFHYLVSKCFVGDWCQFTVLRQKKQRELQVQLSAVRPLVLHDPPDPPQYFIIGGLVFVPLSEPFLWDDFGANYHKDAPISMLWHWFDGVRESMDHEVIVLSQVLASPLTVGFTDFYNVLLVRFNGRKVKNLEHLMLMVQGCEEEYLTFEIERNNVIILPRKEATQQTTQILKDNMISTDRSVHYQHLQ